MRFREEFIILNKSRANDEEKKRSANRIAVIMIKILLLVYKSFHDQAPIYIKNCFEVYRPLRPNLRSSTDSFRLCCHRTRTKAGDCTFTVAAAKEWNKLPTLIKSANSLELLKKLLKTYIFPQTL